MHSFRCFGFAAFGAVAIAAMVVVTTARGQIEAPKGAPPAASTPPSPNLPAAISTPLRPTPQPSAYVELAPGGAPTVHFYASPDSQVEQTHSQLNREGELLASQYAEATDDVERQRIKAQLAELLGRQFELQQQIRENEVAQLEERIKKLRGLIEKRKEARQSIVDNRLEQLLRDADGLGWTGGPSGGSPTFVPVQGSPALNVITPTPIIAPNKAVPPRR